MELEAGTFCVLPIKAARAAGLTPSSGWVLAQLWDHKNREGKCWPSIATLARESGISRSSVFKALEELESKGFVRKTQRPGDGKILNTNEYAVLIPLGVVQTADGVVQEADGVVRRMDGGGTPDRRRTKTIEPNPIIKADLDRLYQVWGEKLGKVAYGRFAKALRCVLADVSADEACARLASYIRSNEARFCSPEGFAARYKGYANPKFQSEVTPVTAAETGNGDY